MWKSKNFKRSPQPIRNEKGVPIITSKYLKAICVYEKMYSNPKLNDKLYLNNKGFAEIEGLEEYINLKSLHLSQDYISILNIYEN